jgi:hypothetical protein
MQSGAGHAVGHLTEDVDVAVVPGGLPASQDTAQDTVRQEEKSLQP